MFFADWKDGLKKFLTITPLVLWFIVFIAYSSATYEPEPAPTPSFSATATDLIAQYGDKEEREAVVGQFVEVTGTVYDPDYVGDILLAGSADSYARIQCDISYDSTIDPNTISEGDVVTLVGEIQDSYGNIELDDCYILSVIPASGDALTTTSSTTKSTSASLSTTATTLKPTTTTKPATTTTSTSQTTATTTKRSTTTKRTTITAAPSSGITLVDITSPAPRNSFATIRIKGKPNTEYSIRVYYSTTASTADGLENKISDADGYVSWTWKIGGRTKPGSHRIKITGGGETFETSIVTTEAE